MAPRIKYVADCVKSLLDQSRKPDSIEVNLSRVEFSNGLHDLPDDLLALIADKSVTINWEDGNTFVFRKEVPVVKKYHGTDTIMVSCDDDKFVTICLPLRMAAPGFELKIEKKTVFPHADISKPDIMETSAVKPLGELIGCKLDEEMIAFGKEHGFPVIFVICERTSKEHDGVFTNERRVQFFEKNQMHYAAEFAKKNNNGELGVYDPRSDEGGNR